MSHTHFATDKFIASVLSVAETETSLQRARHTAELNQLSLSIYYYYYLCFFNSSTLKTLVVE